MLNRGMLGRAHGLYAHAMDKYQSWGAKAIVRRLGAEMQQKFSSMQDLVGRDIPWSNNITTIDPTYGEDDIGATRKRTTDNINTN